jgi:hypothetical protein
MAHDFTCLCKMMDWMGPVASEIFFLGVQYPKAESGEAMFCITGGKCKNWVQAILGYSKVVCSAATKWPLKPRGTTCSRNVRVYNA